jgi:hypothetical protein
MSKRILKGAGPFGLLIVGSFYCLYEFRKLNSEFPKGKVHVYKEDLQRLGINENDYQARTTVSLEEEYEKMMKIVDLSHYENVRGPQPYEDNTEFHNKMKKKIEARKKLLESQNKKKD